MASTQPSAALPFPTSTLASVSPSRYLHAHLSRPTETSKSTFSGPVRPNGRTSTQFRSPSINTGSLSHCAGSAVLRCANTAAVCGIRAEILKVDDLANPNSIIPLATSAQSPTATAAAAAAVRDDAAILSSLSLLVPNIELGTGCSPTHPPAHSAPSPQAQILTQRLRDLLLSSRVLRASDLAIHRTSTPHTSTDSDDDDNDNESQTTKPSIIAYWTLYIDVLFISLDGGALDATWLAVLAALRDVRLPRAWWDEDREMMLCSAESKLARPLKLQTSAVVATVAVFDADAPNVKGGEREGGNDAWQKFWVLADPDAYEERLCEECVTVLVDGERIRSIEKWGGGAVGLGEMGRVVDLAVERWREVQPILEGCISKVN